jgi:hypothetical protein
VFVLLSFKKAITKKVKALHSSNESSTAAAPQSKVSWKYKNIIAADNARQNNGDVHGNIYIRDVHNHPSHISILTAIRQGLDASYTARINTNLPPSFEAIETRTIIKCAFHERRQVYRSNKYHSRS